MRKKLPNHTTLYFFSYFCQKSRHPLTDAGLISKKNTSLQAESSNDKTIPILKKQLFLFILFLLPLTASADDSGTCGRNLTWTYVEATHTLTISGSGEMNNYSYHTNLAPWSGYHEKISTIIIESGVTRIGEYAFYDCSSMVTIDIPNSVTSIGVSAFDNCVNLTSIDIPNSVTNIEDGAFLNCQWLNLLL